MNKFLIITVVCSLMAACVNDPTTSQELGWKTATDSSSDTVTATGTSTGN